MQASQDTAWLVTADRGLGKSILTLTGEDEEVEGLKSTETLQLLRLPSTGKNKSSATGQKRV
jgi:hypothetical protein